MSNSNPAPQSHSNHDDSSHDGSSLPKADSEFSANVAESVNEPATAQSDSQETTDDAADTAQVSVTVEAAFSGAVLCQDFPVPLDWTVSKLRFVTLRFVCSNIKVRAVRLFVGHGGPELDDDAQLCRDSELTKSPDADEPPPLVVFPVMCK